MQFRLRLLVELVGHVVLEADLRRQDCLVHRGRDWLLVTRVVQRDTRQLVCLTTVAPVTDSLS